MSKGIRHGLLAIAAVFCIIYPIFVLYGDGGFWHAVGTSRDYYRMILEWLFWILLGLCGLKWHNISWLAGVLIIFSYLHMMLLPMVWAAGYFVVTLLSGEFLGKFLIRYNGKERIFLSCLLGIMALTISYAVMSVLQVGGIRNIKILNIVLFFTLSIWYLKTHKKVFVHWKEKCNVSKNVYVKLTIITGFVLLAIGRANISIDYDSMWYGLRSAFVLDNKSGIYDNLPLVGTVYTYAKGYETYSLPLSGFSSHGFVYAGNIILAGFVLFIIYKICKLFLAREQALWGALLASAIPGIMNMAITAKSDILTLLVQLMQIYFSLLFLREKKGIWLGCIGVSYIYAQTLKPTAVIFSTTILLAFFLIVFLYKIKLSFGSRAFILLFASLIDLGFIWMRTYLLTGLPENAVWGNLIFRRLGMSKHYPYAESQFYPYRLQNLFSRETVLTILETIKEFFFAPNSEVTDHVILAWGTTLVTFLFFLTVFGAICSIKTITRKKEKTEAGCFLGLLFAGEFLGVLASLWVTWKSDGNYFMLYYAVTVIGAVIYLNNKLIPQKIYNGYVVKIVCSAFVLVNIFFTGANTWAGTYKFSEISYKNKGYFDYQEQLRESMAEMGCVDIYNQMISDPTNQVLAFGPHPNVEQIPCVIESDFDISYWGNIELLSEPDNFLDFVNYREYDFIYLWPGYVKKDSVAYLNLCTLFDNGKVQDIMIEGDNVLLCLGINSDPEMNRILKKKMEQVIEIE